MPHLARLSRRSWLLRAGGLLGLGMLGSPVGCGLFNHALTENPPVLPPLKAGRDAIQIEVILVERPQGDALLGDILWRDINQLSVADPEIRHRLKANGLRVGHVSSRPPEELQSLLGLTESAAANATDEQRLSGRRIWRQSGEETQVQTGEILPECRLSVDDGERSESFEFEQVQCQFRVVTVRKQDGWAKLTFTPEVHFGEQRLRPTVVDDEGFGELSLQMRTKQRVRPFHRHRFDLTLNVGEMVVIGTLPEASNESLGGVFFRTLDDRHLERLLIVRLANMGQVEPMYEP